MAKWTLQKYIESLRDRLDEDTQDFFTDGELIDYINAGVWNLALEMNLEEIARLVSVDGLSVDLPEDFLALKGCFVDGQRVIVGTISDRDSSNDVAYIYGKTLYFNRPRPNKTVELFYVRKPVVMSERSDTCDLEEAHQTIPLFYAMARAKEKDEELGLSQALMNQFNEFKYEMVQEIQNRHSFEGVHFVPMYDDKGGW